jgi:hypothetical protein
MLIKANSDLQAEGVASSVLNVKHVVNELQVRNQKASSSK